MRLAAVVDLDLELGVTLLERRQRPSSGGASSPVRTVRYALPGREHAVDDLLDDGSTSGPDATAVSVHEPEVLALADLHAVERHVAGGDRDLAGRSALELASASPARCPRASFVDMKPVIAARPACTDLVGTTRTFFVAHRRGLLGGQDHVRVVRQDDHVVRRHGLDRLEDVGGRRVHRLAALDDARRAEALEQPPVAASRTRRRRAPVSSVASAVGAPPPSSSRSSRCAVCRCMFAISTPSIDAHARCRMRAPPGVVGVDVHLERRRVADDEQRVAEPLELALERVRVEVVALDDEDRAVAVLGQLLVDRVEADAAPPRPARPGAPRPSAP